MKKTCMYLRKSRAEEDMEIEDVLSRHKSTLLNYAKKNNLNIVDIKEEVVSGASLENRPKVLELLEEIKTTNPYDAVLVMDFDRLTRGDLLEQGIIVRAFKESQTEIITLSQSYDLDKDFDELNIELLGFLARQEYRTIRKRMQRGIDKSVQEGNCHTKAPLGYYKKDKKLYIDEDKAYIVRYIFSSYINGDGARAIANKLNTQGHRNSIGKPLTNDYILRILKNQRYIGNTVWGHRKKKNGVIKIAPQEEWTIVENTHEPIIDSDTFNKVQELRTQRFHPPTKNSVLLNPYAGIVRCSKCGRAYIMGGHRKGKKDFYLRCGQTCGNSSIRLNRFNDLFIEAFKADIEALAFEYESDKVSNPRDYKKEISDLENQKIKIKKRIDSLYEMLEDGVYSKEMFVDRMKKNTNEIEAIDILIARVNAESYQTNKHDLKKEFIEKSKQIIDLFDKIKSTKEKNAILKSIIEKVNITKSNYHDTNLEIFYRI